MKWISIDARCVTVISFLFAINATANNEWFELYNNTRSQGMGGASIAVTSDETSLYRNPANLGSVRDAYGTVLDPELEGSSNFVQQVTSSAIGKAFDADGIKAILNTKRNTYYHAKTQLSPSLVTRNLGIGLIYRNEVSSEMDAAGTFLDHKYQSDVGAVFGTNVRFFDGRVKVGASAKFINRIELINPTLSTATSTDMSVAGSEGSAFAFDGSILLQAPWKLIPTLGVVVRDIGGTKFDKQDGVRLSTQTRPQTVPQSVDVAAAIFPIHANQIRSVWTVEYSDVTNSRVDTDNAKRIHVGIEVNTRDIFFLRMGYNQRYWTAGIEVSAEHFQWQISSYGEEIGTEAAPREDRRLSTKISVRF
ncbi:MAG: hypothetical protein H7061_06195 [Bdellovibrionaceae bacterium]|nr:hypothetical protein [Bdellovibrio sp.]